MDSQDLPIHQDHRNAVKEYVQDLFRSLGSYAESHDVHVHELARYAVTYINHLAPELKFSRQPNKWNLFHQFLQQSPDQEEMWIIGGESASTSHLRQKYNDIKSGTDPAKTKAFNAFVEQAHQKHAGKDPGKDDEANKKVVWKRICSNLNQRCLEADQLGFHLYILAADNHPTSPGQVYTTKQGATNWSMLMDQIHLGSGWFAPYVRIGDLEVWVRLVNSIRVNGIDAAAGLGNDLPAKMSHISVTTPPTSSGAARSPSDTPIERPLLSTMFFMEPEPVNKSSSSRDLVLAEIRRRLLAQFNELISPLRARLPPSPLENFLKKSKLAIELPDGWCINDIDINGEHRDTGKKQTTEHANALLEELRKIPCCIRVVRLEDRAD